MPTYKVSYTELHRIDISRIQYFDTENQDHWESFRNDATENYGIDPEDYPEIAPSDPTIWFELIAQLDPQNYDDYKEDCHTMRNGGYETVFELEDDNGKIIERF